MQPRHFIENEIEVFERAWTIISDPNLPAGYKPGLAEIGISAAHNVCASRWHNMEQRAGQVGAALMRVIYGEQAQFNCQSLDAWIQMSIPNTTDPPTREALGIGPLVPPPPTPPPPG